MTDVSIAQINPAGQIAAGALSNVSEIDFLTLNQPAGGGSTWNFSSHTVQVSIAEVSGSIGDCSAYSSGSVTMRGTRAGSMAVSFMGQSGPPKFDLQCFSGTISSDVSVIENLFVDNSQGVDFSGMSPVTGANMIGLENTTGLQNLNGFDQLTIVTGHIALKNMPDFASLSGLGSIDVIQGDLNMTDLPSLTTTDGLNQSLSEVSRVRLKNTPSLVDLSALSSALQSATNRVEIHIRGNFGADLSFLEPVTNVELYIDPSLADALPLMSASSAYCQDETSYYRYDEDYQDGAGSSTRSSTPNTGDICAN